MKNTAKPNVSDYFKNIKSKIMLNKRTKITTAIIGTCVAAIVLGVSIGVPLSLQNPPGGGALVNNPSDTNPLVINDPNLTTINASEYSGMGYTSLIITSPITEIGMNAFANNDLMSVTLPNSLVTIGDGAFQNNKLESLIIPSSVITIRLRAFQNNNFTSLTIPSNILVSNGSRGLWRTSFIGNPRLLTVILPRTFAEDSGALGLIAPLSEVFGSQVTRYEDLNGNVIVV